MEPLEIVGVVEEEATEPRNDCSAGSALYAVPVRLSRSPDAIEQDLLVALWDRPPSFTTMHRPGIMRVSGDLLILDGTTIEEVQRYHSATLRQVVDKANEEAVNYRARTEQEADRQASVSQDHRENVADVASRIKF